LMMIYLGAVVALILTLRRRWLFLAGWTAALAGAAILNVALKYIIQRPRPIYAAEFVTHYSYGYPSGHAMESLVGYGMLAYLLVVFSGPSRRLQSTIVLAAAILIGAIVLSRLCLGVHYLSDIIGGYSGGVFWLSACIAALEITRRRPR